MLEYLEKYKPRIDEEIERELNFRLTEVKDISPHLVPVIEAMQELSRGGKRLRGLLTILGYELAGQVPDSQTIKAAVVMELFHLGLLIQDDVMDRDDVRRGVETVHARYHDRHLGESIAICAGDLTYGWGMEILGNLKSQMLANSQIIKAMTVWGKYFARVGYGQILDVIGEQRGDTGEEEVLQVLMLKSGEYTCVLPLALGATLGGGDNALLERLFKYGMELGWVFQLRDDWLGAWGDSSKTGKPVGGDMREGKKSYATLYGKEKTEAEIVRHWEEGKQEAMGNKVMEGLLEWMAERDN